MGVAGNEGKRLREELLRLLEEDREFRYIVAGYLGLREILERLEEHSRKFNEILEILRRHQVKLEEYDRKFNELLEILKRHEVRLAEHDRKFNEILEVLKRHEARLEEHDRKFNEILGVLEGHGRLLKEHDEKLGRIEASLGSLGARLGVDLERMILNLYRDMLQALGVSVERVEKITFKDVDGRYYRRGARLELDIYVHDNIVYFIEVKSLATVDDVEWFETRCEIFERILGRRPDRKIIVAVNILKEALERARELGIEVVYGRVIEIERP